MERNGQMDSLAGYAYRSELNCSRLNGPGLHRFARQQPVEQA